MTDRELKVAVVTGGHAYDVQGLAQLFRSLPDIDTYIQHMDDFAAVPETIGLTEGNEFHPVRTRREYDVVVFYCMMEGAPEDEEIPLHRGAPRTALDELGQSGQGILVLHHALLHYPASGTFDEIVGIRDREIEGWYFGQNLCVEIAGPPHPITDGLEPFKYVDETYVMPEPGENSRVLLTVDHPRSMRKVAWVRQYRESRVFCLQLGHDRLVWTHPGFRTLLQRGIRWCAG